MLSRAASQSIGYALFGLSVGLVLLTLAVIFLFRYGVAEVRDPTWVAILLAILLLPPGVMGALGFSRARRATVTPFQL